MKKISISIPSYNEELSIVPLISELKKITEQLKDYNFEYIFINDHNFAGIGPCG